MDGFLPPDTTVADPALAIEAPTSRPRRHLSRQFLRARGAYLLLAARHASS